MKKKVSATPKKNEITINGKKYYYEFHDWTGNKLFGAIHQKKKEFFFGRTKFQGAEIFESPFFGRYFQLDNVTMLTDKDEFMYHEMMTHPGLFTHKNPRSVLIIGGGDGGCVREAARHKSVKRIVLCEIDKGVIDLAKKYFPAVAGKLKDPRVDVQVQDGYKYVLEHQGEFDIVIVDSTDPVGPGTVLFSTEFYQACYGALRKDGIMMAQLGSAFVIGHHVKASFKKMKEVFPLSFLYWIQMPCYADGFYMLAFLSKKYHPQRNFQKARYNKLNLPLKYYNDEMQEGAFKLPVYVRKLSV